MPGVALNCKGGAYVRGGLKLQGGCLSVEAGMIRMVTTALPITVRGSEKVAKNVLGRLLLGGLLLA